MASDQISASSVRRNQLTFMCFAISFFLLGLYFPKIATSSTTIFAGKTEIYARSNVQNDVTGESVNELAESLTLQSAIDVEQQSKQFAKAEPARRNLNNRSKLLGLLHYGLVPQIVCPTMVRLGAVGDGGKWICNPWWLKNPCTVVAFGINNEASFEQELAEISGKTCQFYGFDRSERSKSVFEQVANGKFFSYMISNTTNSAESEYTIPNVIDQLQIKKIDIFKVDIEFSEFTALPLLWNENFELKVPVCQLLLEVHVTYAQPYRDLMQKIEQAGFLMFSREANSFCRPLPCYEYAFIHRTCLSEYGLPNARVLTKNF